MNSRITVNDGVTLRYKNEPLVVCREYWKSMDMQQTTNNALLYYVEGDGSVLVNERQCSVVHSGILIVPKNSKIRFQIKSQNSIGRLVSVVMSDHFLWEYACQFGKSLTIGGLATSTAVINREYFSHFFQSLLLYCQHRNLMREDLLRNRVFEIIYLVEELMECTRNGQSQPRLVVEEHTDSFSLDDPILGKLCDPATYQKSISELAREYGVSTSTLKRHFKEKCKMPIRQWINSKRLERARFMLIYSGKSVKEIAFECGFCSASYFIRAYKQKFGFTPMADTFLNPELRAA